MGFIIYTKEFTKLLVYRPWIFGRLWVPFITTFNLTYRREYVRQHTVNYNSADPDDRCKRDIQYALHTRFETVDKLHLRNLTIESDNQVTNKGLYLSDFKALTRLFHALIAHGKIIPNLSIDIDLKGNPLKKRLLDDFIAYNHQQMKVYQLQSDLLESYFNGFKIPNLLVTKGFRFFKRQVMKLERYCYDKVSTTTSHALQLMVMAPAVTLFIIGCTTFLALHILAAPVAPILGLISYIRDKCGGLQRAERKLAKCKQKIKDNPYYRKCFGLSEHDQARVVFNKWLDTPQNDKGFSQLPESLRVHIAQNWFGGNEHINLYQVKKSGDNNFTSYTDRLTIEMIDRVLAANGQGVPR